MKYLTKYTLSILLALSTSGIAQASDIRSATCDAGWDLDIRGGTDLCTSRNIWGDVKGHYTIPSGTTGFFGDPKWYGWELKVNHLGDHDYWEKK